MEYEAFETETVTAHEGGAAFVQFPGVPFEQVNELSLRYAYRRAAAAGAKSFAILSPFRLWESPLHWRNFGRSERLIADLGVARTAVVPLLLHRRNHRGPAEDARFGEPHVFAMNVALFEALRVNHQLGRQIVLYAGRETEDRVTLFLEGSAVDVGAFDPAEIARAVGKARKDEVYFRNPSWDRSAFESGIRSADDSWRARAA